MKLLLDACVWGGAKDALIAFGHDVIWAGDWPEDPGDEVLLSAANAERRVLARSVEGRHPEIALQLQLYGWLYEQAVGKPPVGLQVHSGSGDLSGVP